MVVVFVVVVVKPLATREGRVRSVHTLYTLCDNLSPHSGLVSTHMHHLFLSLYLFLLEKKENGNFLHNFDIFLF